MRLTSASRAPSPVSPASRKTCYGVPHSNFTAFALQDHLTSRRATEADAASIARHLQRRHRGSCCDFQKPAPRSADRGSGVVQPESIRSSWSNGARMSWPLRRRRPRVRVAATRATRIFRSTSLGPSAVAGPERSRWRRWSRRHAPAGFSKLVSGVFPENAPSRALLRKLGFREIGTHERHGKLDGAWRDVIVVERLL